MSQVRWVIPEAAEPVTRAARDPSASAVVPAGRPIRIGLLDNTKDNAHLLLKRIGERVKQEFDAELITYRKGNATVGAPVEILEALARETDCVLTAMAD